jgi:exodeoxyribonuclease V gamma subunit
MLLQQALRYPTTTSRRIDLTIGNARVTGTIDGFSDHDLAYMRVSKIKPKDRLRAWILHLVVTAQRFQDGLDHKPAWPLTTRVLAIDGTWIYSGVPESTAREQLELLLSLYHSGKRRPLPFFDQSSYATCDSLTKSTDELKALQQGAKKYAINDSADAWKYDESDASIALCMRNRDPFEDGVDSEFLRLAKKVWLAPIEYLQEQN